MSVVDDAIKTATAGFKFEKPLDRLRGSYVRRRAPRLHELNNTWDATRLSAQLKSEIDGIAAYIGTKKALIDGTETVQPRHLDLKAASRYRTKTNSDAINGLIDDQVRIAEEVYRSERSTYIEQIIWRAVAIHDLWKSLGPPPKLEVAALDELLDRRLRVVEQMSCNVNAFMGLHLDTTDRSWKVSGPNGPWKDGYLVRNFEYANLPAAPFFPHFPIKDWVPDSSLSKILYSPKHGNPVYVPKNIGNAWKIAATKGATIWLTFQPQARKLADVIRRMLEPPREDFLDRSLLFCDMVGSVLNIEALWFALRRRHQNDDLFNAIPTTSPPFEVSLGPVVRFDNKRDLDMLMCDDRDPHFENLDVPFEDLQVGDFVRFWNSRIYDLLVDSGAWGSEFSLVMDIDVDLNGNIRKLSDGPKIKLAGHGIKTHLYNKMAAELIEIVGKLIDKLYSVILSQGAGQDELPIGTKYLIVDINGNPVINMDGDPIYKEHSAVRWDPYEPVGFPGAWWVMIPELVWRHNWAYASTSEVLKAIPRTVAHQSASGGVGYKEPPDKTAVYFPLNEPVMPHKDADGDSWRAYLLKRKSDASFRVTPGLLTLLAVDGRLTQGLYYRGANPKIPVVRPKVRP